jgi:hypothetical protein
MKNVLELQGKAFEGFVKKIEKNIVKAMQENKNKVIFDSSGDRLYLENNVDEIQSQLEDSGYSVKKMGLDKGQGGSYLDENSEHDFLTGLEISWE